MATTDCLRLCTLLPAPSLAASLLNLSILLLAFGTQFLLKLLEHAMALLSVLSRMKSTWLPHRPAPMELCCCSPWNSPILGSSPLNPSPFAWTLLSASLFPRNASCSQMGEDGILVPSAGTFPLEKVIVRADAC